MPVYPGAHKGRYHSFRQAFDASVLPDLAEGHSGVAVGFLHALEHGEKEPCLNTLDVLAKSFKLYPAINRSI